MGLLLKLIPWYGRAAVIVSLVLAGAGWGYVQGVVHTEHEAVAVVSARAVAAGAATSKQLERVSTRLQAIDADRARMREELSHYVQSDNSGCDLSRGAVVVLNRAAGGVSDTSSIAEAALRGASVVTERAALEYAADIAERYRRLAACHDALNDGLDEVYGPPPRARGAEGVGLCGTK